MGKPDGYWSERSSERALLCLVLAGLWLYLSAELFSISMSLDGTVYAGIARGLAAGEGSFWSPPFFLAGPAGFHDHPPLGLWLQSLWFKLWGDAFWVERSWIIACTAVLITMLALMWHSLGQRRGLWWPLLLLMLMPVTTRAIKGNTLELLIAVTGLAGVWAAWISRRQPRALILVALAALAGGLIKGPAALFPLAAPSLFALTMQDGLRSAIIRGAVTTATFVGLCALISLLPPVRDNLEAYFHTQLVSSLSGQRLIEHGRLYQFGQLILQLVCAGGCAMLGWAAGRQAISPLTATTSRRTDVSQIAFALLVIGLSAALPLLVSPRQYKHYLLPALPYFALALALWVPPMQRCGIRQWVFWSIAGLLTLTAVIRSYIGFGAPGGDAQHLNDAAHISEVATRADARTVGFCEPAAHLQAYLYRYHGWQSITTGQTTLRVCANKPKGYLQVPHQPLSAGLRLWIRSSPP